MNAHDDDPVDQALRAAMRRAVDDVHPTPDLDGVLAGARRADTGSAPVGGEVSPVRRRLVAVAAVAASVAAIVGVSVGADLFSPGGGAPPVTTSRPSPDAPPAPSVTEDPQDPSPEVTPDPAEDAEAPDADAGPESSSPVTPQQLADGRWLVPVYRMGLGGSLDGPVPRSYPLRVELVEVDSAGDPASLLAAALDVRLTGSVANYGFPSLADPAPVSIDDSGEGPVTVTVDAEGLAPGIPDRDGVLEASVQQVAWTAQSVLGEEVEVEVRLPGREPEVATPSTDDLGTLQIAYPVIGSEVVAGQPLRIAGLVPPTTASMTYGLNRQTPTEGGFREELVADGDLTVSTETDINGWLVFDVEVRAPQRTGEYFLDLIRYGQGRGGDQSIDHVFDIVAD